VKSGEILALPQYFAHRYVRDPALNGL